MAVGTEGNGKRWRASICRGPANLDAVAAPDAAAPVPAASGDVLSVRAEGDGKDNAVMLEAHELGTGLGVPHVGRVVRCSGRRDLATIRTVRKRLRERFREL